MSRGLIGLALAAGVIASGLGFLIASAEAPNDKTRPPISGRAPGDAFFVDFSGGFDPVTHVLADWDVASEWFAVSYRPDNVKFEDGRLTLRTRRVKTKVSDYTSSEFQRSGFYGYGRYEVVMRASNAPGVVSSFFTYAGADMGDPHDEIDFELLGRSTRTAHTNYFSNGSDNPVDVDLWFDASEGDHLYAFDWLPDSVTWYIDGMMVRRVASGGDVRMPSTTGRVMASVWSANRKVSEWAGWPKMRTASATYSCMSHVPISKKGRQCSDAFMPVLPH